MSKITKADLLNGVDNIKSEYFEEAGGELEIKPLSAGQWAQVQECMSQGVERVGEELKVDASKAQKGQAGAKFTAVSYGLSVNDRWTTSEVEKLKPSLVDALYNRILEISGLKDEVQKMEKEAEEMIGEEKVVEGVKNFREGE